MSFGRNFCEGYYRLLIRKSMEEEESELVRKLCKWKKLI